MSSKVSRVLCYNLIKHLSQFSGYTSKNSATFCLLRHFSSIRDRAMRGDRRSDASEDVFIRRFEPNQDDHDIGGKRSNITHQGIPNPIPNRPLRGDKRNNLSQERFDMKLNQRNDDDDGEREKRSHQVPSTLSQNGSMSELKRGEYKNEFSSNKFAPGINFDRGEEIKQSGHSLERPTREEKRENQFEVSFLEKFKLGEKKEKSQQDTSNRISEVEAKAVTDSPPQDADEIFKKMKETGLIPNAVAMLDGLCKDGLVQEAMKLFGLMREKGTIPEVVIFTAVVEGFCKAQKLDDAMRIFRKMQNNGISPNTFSYTVLIQGLCKGRRLNDAIDFCVEMLEAGHSPNVATFSGLIDGFCGEKGVAEAEAVIRRLREKGFLVDEKAVREHLDKKGPFSPLVWEAIFGKKTSQRLF